MLIAAVILAITVNAAAVMYQARQETRRQEIGQQGTALIAAALARCIDGTHAAAVGLSGTDMADEAARVRESATMALAALSPAVTAMLSNSESSAADRRAL